MKKFIVMTFILFTVNVLASNGSTLSRDVRSKSDLERVCEFKRVIATIRTTQQQDELGRIVGYESWIFSEETEKYERFVKTVCLPQQTNIPRRVRS